MLLCTIACTAHPALDIVGNIYRACIMDSDMLYFLISSLCIKRQVHRMVYFISRSYLLSLLCNSFSNL